LCLTENKYIVLQFCNTTGCPTQKITVLSLMEVGGISWALQETHTAVKLL
jgi:hypothetical protein